jgi:hypothetical protein
MTGVAFTLGALAFALTGLGRGSVVLLGVAGIMIDMAVQSSFIFGQHTIYRLDPVARARLNSVYIATFFFGGAIGSLTGAIAYHAGGWRSPCSARYCRRWRCWPGRPSARAPRRALGRPRAVVRRGGEAEPRVRSAHRV